MFRKTGPAEIRSEPLDALVNDARRGDGSAFGCLVAKLRPALLQGIRKQMGRATRAILEPEDVLQDSLLVAMRSLGQLRASNLVGFQAWLLGIARNQIRHTRRFNREKCRPRRNTALPPSLHSLCGTDVLDQLETTSWASPEKHTLQKEDARRLRSRVEGLKRGQRLALVLRDSLELSWQTVALVLDHPTEEAARQFHYRARRALGATRFERRQRRRPALAPVQPKSE